MRVKVLQHHIDQGKRGKVSSCAIALALQEQFPEAADIRVGQFGMVVNDYSWSFSRESGIPDFIRSFDAGLPVQPFEFEIQIGQA